MLLHGCCHNRAGIITTERGACLASQVPPPQTAALFAYQGFARGIEDAETFASSPVPDRLLVATPFSRTVGLYNSRQGRRLHLVCATKAVADVRSPR